MSYTERSGEYFLNTGTRFPRRIIWAMGAIKLAAAVANSKLGLLDVRVAGAIAEAAKELMDGVHDGSITVDVFQTGSGTGLNMNVNEVIARRASEILGGAEVHPNDHVNMCQSSNDVVPSAIRIAAVAEASGLLSSLGALIRSLDSLASRTSDVVKAGRTHLRDALPVTMGQEFAAYADEFRRDRELIEGALSMLRELPLGGTAVGTGLNAHPDFAALAIEEVNRATGLEFSAAADKARGMKLLSDVVALSGALRVAALDLYRLGQDLRLMYSGPFTAIGEIDIPQGIAGSSIMPGKTNPVTVEAAMLASIEVIGLDYANTMAGAFGEFELSMAVPLMGYNALRQISLLGEAMAKLSSAVLDRVVPLRERAASLAERSPALVTVISPIIGYEKAAEVAKRVAGGEDLRRALREAGVDEATADRLLDLRRLVRPGIPAKEG